MSQLADTLRAASFQYRYTFNATTAPDDTAPTLAQLADPAHAGAQATAFAEHYNCALRHAGSLSYQRLAHRVVGLIAGSWLLGAPAHSPDPTSTWVEINDGAARALILAAPAPQLNLPATPPPPEEDRARAMLAAVHSSLDPIAQAYHHSTRVSLPNLHANTLTAFGGLVRNLVRKGLLDAGAAMELATVVADLDPAWRGKGWFEHLRSHTPPAPSSEPGPGATPEAAQGSSPQHTGAEGKEAVAYYRNSCCHWYTTGEDNCDWCTHRDTDARRADMRQRLLGEAPTNA